MTGIWDFIWSTALKDLRRKLRDPWALVLWVGIPFVVLGLLSLAFGGGEVKPQAELLVVDEDDSLVSGLLKGAFGRGPATELVAMEEVEREEGFARIRVGDASALLVIPEGFSLAVMEEQPVSLTLLTNPAQCILPGIVEQYLSVLTNAGFYLQRLLGEPVQVFFDGPPAGADTFPDATIASFSVTVNQLLARVSDLLFPPVLAVETTVVEDEATATQASLNIGALFFQGMFFMALIFIALGFSDDLWVEHNQGTLRCLLSTPQALTGALLGKLLAAGIIIFAISLVGLAAGFALYDFAWTWLLPSALWATFSALVLLSLFTLIQLHAASQKGGNFLTSFVVFPLLLVGGSFFPFELMPRWMAAVGRWTPNGWAMEQAKAIMSGIVSPARLAVVSLGLLLVGALAVLWAAWRLRRRFVVA